MANFKVTLNNTTPSFTLKNTSIAGARIDKLDDIVETASSKVDGAVLVYNKSKDQYVLQRILEWDDDHNNYKVDGGDF